jgi:GT2 family glycosyltransferase
MTEKGANLMITVIIPLINLSQKTNELLDCISNNEVKPDEIILIDNGSTEDIDELVVKTHPDLPIRHIRLEENIGVNPAWNLGVKEAKNNIISILNNDILVSKYFFRLVTEAMQDETVGMVVPVASITDRNVINELTEYEPPTFKDMSFREGYAMTMRKEIYDKIGGIPETLKIYSGDCYLFDACVWLGYKCYYITNNKIFHHQHSTLHDQQMTDHGLLHREHDFWEKTLRPYLKEKIDIIKDM